MKRLNRLAALSLLSLTGISGYAQQALWGGSALVSPQIHDNNTVTFRLRAPEARKVQITGDFLPTEKKETPFGKFDMPGLATWTKTTMVSGNSQPGLHSNRNCIVTLSWLTE